MTGGIDLHQIILKKFLEIFFGLISLELIFKIKRANFFDLI